MLPSALPDGESDLVDLSLDDLNVHVDMSDILLQLPSWTLYGDEPRLDGHCDSLWHVELLGLENVTHS